MKKMQKVLTLDYEKNFSVEIWYYDKPKKVVTRTMKGKELNFEIDWHKSDVCKITGTKGKDATPIEFKAIIRDKKTGGRLKDSDGNTTDETLDSFCYKREALIGELITMSMHDIEMYKKNTKEKVKWSWYD